MKKIINSEFGLVVIFCAFCAILFITLYSIIGSVTPGMAVTVPICAGLLTAAASQFIEI